MTNAEALKIADEAHRAAYTAFTSVQDDYMAGRVDDAEFFAAKADLDTALAAWEVAFAAVEAEDNEAEEVDVEDDAQMVLL